MLMERRFQVMVFLLFTLSSLRVLFPLLAFLVGRQDCVDGGSSTIVCQPSGVEARNRLPLNSHNGSFTTSHFVFFIIPSPFKFSQVFLQSP